MAKEFSAGIVALRVCDKFLDEAFCIERKRALRIPTDHGPSPYRSAALHKRCDADVFDANGDSRGEDGDTISGGCQVDERIRRATFQEHTRLHMRGLTRGIEPDTRSEFMPKQQQRVVHKGADFDQTLSPQGMGVGKDCDGVNRIQETTREPLEAGGHDGKVHLAALEATGLASRAALHEQHLNVGMLAAIVREKTGQQRRHDVRGCSHSQRTGLPTLERKCPFSEEVCVRQQTPALVEKIFTFRRQLERSSDAMEQANPQFALQRLNLPRGCRLADLQTGRRVGEPPGFGGRDEGSQGAQVQSTIPIFASILLQ